MQPDLSRALLDSAGIRLLTRALERIRARGGRVRILKSEAHVFRIFEVVGVHDMLPFADAT